MYPKLKVEHTFVIARVESDGVHFDEYFVFIEHRNRYVLNFHGLVLLRA